MNRFAAAIAVEAARHAIDNTPAVVKVPGSVQSAANGVASVLIDGASLPVPITDLVGVAAPRRVMVEFHPSGAAYIVNTI